MFAKKADPAVVRRITGWAIKAIGRSSVSVAVREVRCQDVNCVPVETAVFVLDESGECIWRGNVLKPIAEVSEQDIVDLRILETLYNQKKATQLDEIEVSIAEHLNELTSVEEQNEFLNSIERIVASHRKKIAASGLGSTQTVTTNTSVTQVPMKPRERPESNTVEKMKSRSSNVSGARVLEDMEWRHNKGSRVRGCPCCDPDNLENVVDSYLFLQPPP